MGAHSFNILKAIRKILVDMVMHFCQYDYAIKTGSAQRRQLWKE